MDDDEDKDEVEHGEDEARDNETKCVEVANGMQTGRGLDMKVVSESLADSELLK